MARFFAWLTISVLVILVAGGALVGWFQFEGNAPEIKAKDIPDALGRKSHISVSVSEDRTGLRMVRAEIVQNGQVVLLPEHKYESHPFYERKGVFNDTISWDIDAAALGLGEGEAVLRIVASDQSWRNGFKGNQAVLDIKSRVDITPPVIALRSTVHNIRMGGAGLISFALNEEPVRAGVAVGKRFFPAYAIEGKENSYITLIAVPYDSRDPGPLMIEVTDLAGNIAKTSVPCKILRRRVKVDRINISDSFLQRKVPDLAMHYPELKGSLLEQFLIINNKIRKMNNEQLASICRNGEPAIMWHGSFVRMSGALRARFADFRHYRYKGKEIDTAYHMGVDIADRTHSPVPAGNSGRVKFADFLGIYGNTVVIDHGAGLFSTYSHLSQMNVSKGDTVERGQVIGLTGMTGLAGGDHLHYGMMINGFFVNPVEWWDMKWIRDHILANIR